MLKFHTKNFGKPRKINYWFPKVLKESRENLPTASKNYQEITTKKLDRTQEKIREFLVGVMVTVPHDTI